MRKHALVPLHARVLCYGVHAQVRWAGDRCCVCDSDVDYDVDQLVNCDGCGITCHQSCYGIPEVPGPDEIWLCRTCELKEKVRLLGHHARAGRL